MNNLKYSSDICKLILKGYFAQAKDKIKNTNVDVNETNENKQTPLILCSLIEDPSWGISLAQLLLELGADIERADDNKMNVLHYCAIYQQKELLKLLLESVDFNINKGDILGNSPLIYAIVSENEDVTNMFIQYYLRYQIDFDKANFRGINAYMQACLRGHLDLIETLEKFGINKNAKDSTGTTALMYKRNAIIKFDLNHQVNESRRRSRMVRFDDIEQVLALQRQTMDLITDSHKLTNFVDENFDKVTQMKANVKKVKQNKIDMYYINKSYVNSKDICGNIVVNDNLTIRKIRPQTAFFTSKDLLKQNNWYSLLGPLCTSLEQQYSPSYKSFTKSESSNIDLTDSFSGKSKVRQRKLSRSLASHSRRNSIASRGTTNDDSSDSGINSNKTKKKLESVISAKTICRNISRMSSNNSLL